MIRSTCLSLLMLTAIGMSACSLDGRSDQERALASFEDRHFLDTRIHLANAIKHDPDNANLRRLLGETALALGDGQVAETAFKQAIERDASLKSAIDPFLAHAYLQQQKLEEALELVGILKDDNAYSLRLKAQARLQNGEMTEAWQTIEKAFSIAPEDADILSLAGQYQLSIGNIDEAQSFADRALTVAEPTVEAYLLQGRIHSIQGELEKALEQYDEASKRFRDHVRVYMSQAAIHADRRDTEKLDAAIANIERISPGHPSATYIVAQYSLVQGDNDKAYELAQSLESVSQNNPPLLMLLAEVQINKGNYQQAISHLRAFLRLSPQHPSASLLLAKSLEKSGNLRDAVEVVTGAVSRASSPKSYIAYAAHLAKKTNDPILPLLERRAASPALSEIQDQLTRVQKAVNSGNWQTASNIYDGLTSSKFADHHMQRRTTTRWEEKERRQRTRALQSLKRFTVKFLLNGHPY